MERRQVPTIDVGKRVHLRNEMHTETEFLTLPEPHVLSKQWEELITYSHEPNEATRAAYAAGWADTIQQVMQAAISVAMHIEGGTTVVVQGAPKNYYHFVIASLAQLFMNAHYRTVAGFCALLNKDWIGLCFPFADAMGFKDNDTLAPFFELFINCLAEYVREYPLHFEYGDDFLYFTLEQAFSMRFGTFAYHKVRFFPVSYNVFDNLLALMESCGHSLAVLHRIRTRKQSRLCPSSA